MVKVSDNTMVWQEINKQEDPYMLLVIIESHNHCEKWFGEKQIFFSHMLCKEKNGMPVGSSVRADTWKLWEMKSSLGFWFPYMTCWLCQRNKGFTALYSAIFRAVFARETLKEWGNISPQDEETACLPPAPNLQDLQAQWSSPTTQPTSCAADFWLSTSPCGSGMLGNPAQVC